MEPQRIHLTSDLLIFLRAHCTSPKEEEEIKEQVKNLLQASIIKKKSYYSYTTLLYNCKENMTVC